MQRLNHLRVGELEVWLDYLGETDLARDSRELRQEFGCRHGHAGRAWLEATGRVAMPVLSVSPPLLNLGTVSNQAPFMARLDSRAMLVAGCWLAGWTAT